MGQWLTVIGLLLTSAIGIWRFVKKLRNEKKKRAEEAKKMYQEALKSNDISKLNAAIARLNSKR